MNYHWRLVKYYVSNFLMIGNEFRYLEGTLLNEGSLDSFSEKLVQGWLHLC